MVCRKTYSSLLLFLTCSQALILQSSIFADQIQLQELMTQKEIEQTGLEALTPEQQKAFSTWLEKWTQKVIQQAPSYHSSISIPNWIRSWPLFLRPNANVQSPEVENARRNANQKIYRNMNGTKIELFDGSIWEILSFDQPVVNLWKRDDRVTIKKSEDDLMRPYLILNERLGEEVGASLLQKASPDFQKPKEPPSYFQNSHTVTKIDTQNGSVTLSNGTKWNIQPIDQLRVQTNWKMQDRIRIEPSGDAYYSWKLKNLDGGDFVLAMKIG